MKWKLEEFQQVERRMLILLEELHGVDILAEERFLSEAKELRKKEIAHELETALSF